MAGAALFYVFRVRCCVMVAATLLGVFATAIVAVLRALRVILTRAAIHRCLSILALLLPAARVFPFAALHAF